MSERLDVKPIDIFEGQRTANFGDIEGPDPLADFTRKITREFIELFPGCDRLIVQGVFDGDNFVGSVQTGRDMEGVTRAGKLPIQPE